MIQYVREVSYEPPNGNSRYGRALGLREFEYWRRISYHDFTAPVWSMLYTNRVSEQMRYTPKSKVNYQSSYN